MAAKAVTTAVIAAAGFGTRFLPQTKAMPKEMLPLVDKPIIQRIVEELVEAGIRDIIIVSNYAKRSIEDHFDVPSAELVAVLKASKKDQQLADLYAVADMANFVYIRQKEPLGNAAPLLYAQHILAGKPFIYTWGDDFIDARPSRFSQMIDAYNATSGSIVSCIRADKDDAYDRYGIVDGEARGEHLVAMRTIVEKPGKARAPSNLASVSSYLFAPEIVEYVNRIYAAHTNEHELSIQTAMQEMIDDGHSFFGLEIQQAIYRDTGNKLEYLKAVLDFALEREDIGPELEAYLRSSLERRTTYSTTAIKSL